MAWERAPRAYLVVGSSCVGFKWHFSVKMARWSTPRVPFKGTRGVFWGAREVVRKPKRTVLKLRARTWALRAPRIHLHAASHAKHSPLFSPEKGHFLAFTPGPLTAILGRQESEFNRGNFSPSQRPTSQLPGISSGPLNSQY